MRVRSQITSRHDTPHTYSASRKGEKAVKLNKLSYTKDQGNETSACNLWSHETHITQTKKIPNLVNN